MDNKNIKAVVFLVSHAITKERLVELKKHLPKDCKFIWQRKPVNDVVEEGDQVVDFADDYTVWRKALENAGIDFVAPSNCSVYADNRLLSVFPREDVEFTFDTQGKTFVSVRDGKSYKGKNVIKIKAKSGIAFEINE